MMTKKYYEYYKDIGVREVCRAVKNKDNTDLKNLAMDMMVLHFAESGMIEDGSVIIPIPQHTGRAEYTKEIAERLVKYLKEEKKFKNILVLDILRCSEHRPVYECKKKGDYPETEYFCDWSESKIPAPEVFGYAFGFDVYENIYLLDNVIGTGKTMMTARDCGLRHCKGKKHSSWICKNRHIARPLVYSVDSTKISLSVARELFLV